VSDLPHPRSSNTTQLNYPSKAVHAYILQVIVLTNHMNGKDTHIRGLRILGPEESVATPFSPARAHAFLLLGKNQTLMVPTILSHGRPRHSRCIDRFVRFD